jgi:hypothetical protein
MEIARPPAKPETSIPQNVRALHADPEYAFGVYEQPENATGWERRSARVIEQTEADPIETHEPVLSADPKITIGGLCD